MKRLGDWFDVEYGYAGRPGVRAGRLSLLPGECLGIFGHNGSGKTTLVRGLLGLLPMLGGRHERPAGPLRFGYLSQYRGINPAWPMSAFDAAGMNVSAHRRFGRLTSADRAAVTQSLEQMHINDLADRSFHTLSGGQQQRVLLAGALAAKPDVLVLDEPTDGLDVASRNRLLQTLADLKSGGLCVVLISHDVEDLLAASDEVAWLRPGDAVQPSQVECLKPEALGRQLLQGGHR